VIVELTDGAVADAAEVGPIIKPGERNTDKGRDDDHQDLVMFAHYGDHGCDGGLKRSGIYNSSGKWKAAKLLNPFSLISIARETLGR
jgi:hypothetical protein